MKTYLKYLILLSLFLKAGISISQDLSFEKYISGFKPISLPYNINKEEIEEIAQDSSYIGDIAVSKFISTKHIEIGHKLMQHFLHHYFALVAKNDSITAVVYLKEAPVQGALYVIEIALYHTKNKKLIDRMTIARYNISIDKQNEFSNETNIEFSNAEIRKDLSIFTSTGLFQMTIKGFKVLTGSKDEATDW